MLPRAQRLSTAEFNRAYEGGRVLRHPLLLVRVFSRQDGQNEVRAAFVVPKKLGRAVLRNRLRRRLRERYRLLNRQAAPGQEMTRPPGGSDLIFQMTPLGCEAKGDELDAALMELLKRAARPVVPKLAPASPARRQ